MKRNHFLLISAIGSFGFGAMMFFIPNFAAVLLGIDPAAQTLSVLRGMGGLIIGSGAINYFLRNHEDTSVIKGLLLTNIITHALGLCADIFGVTDGALTIAKMAPVECTHLFIGVGSLIYFMKLKKTKFNYHQL